MTIRELRQTLTGVYNQQMTVKELRNILFEIENQDREIDITDILEITYNK